MSGPALWGQVAGGVQHGAIRCVSEGVVIREDGFANSRGRDLPKRTLITSNSDQIKLLKLEKELKSLRKAQKKSDRILGLLKKWSEKDGVPEELKELFQANGEYEPTGDKDASRGGTS